MAEAKVNLKWLISDSMLKIEWIKKSVCVCVCRQGLLYDKPAHWTGIKNGVDLPQSNPSTWRKTPFIDHREWHWKLLAVQDNSDACWWYQLMVEVKPRQILCLHDFLTSRFNHCGEVTISLLWLSPLSYHLQKIKKSCQSWTYPVTTGKLWLQAKSSISSLLHLNQWPESNQNHQQEASPLCEWMGWFKQDGSCNVLPGEAGKPVGIQLLH